MTKQETNFEKFVEEKIKREKENNKEIIIYVEMQISIIRDLERINQENFDLERRVYEENYLKYKNKIELCNLQKNTKIAKSQRRLEFWFLVKDVGIEKMIDILQKCKKIYEDNSLVVPQNTDDEKIIYKILNGYYGKYPSKIFAKFETKLKNL